MTTFSFADTKAILKDPAVDMSMKSIVLSRGVKVEKHAPWRYADKDVPTEPYRLFRACVERAVQMAHDSTHGRERERLLSLLRMVPGDDVMPVAIQVGLACEDYAVTMQNGSEGMRSYRERFPA